MPTQGFPEREYVRQMFENRAVAVGTGPTPLIDDPALASAYIDSFLVSVPSTAANSVFIGGPGVTIANGLELVPGSLPNFTINQNRVLYELLRPLLELAAIAGCQIQQPDMIPFVCWDLSQVNLVAAAATGVTIAFFRSPFV